MKTQIPNYILKLETFSQKKCSVECSWKDSCVEGLISSVVEGGAIDKLQGSEILETQS